MAKSRFHRVFDSIRVGWAQYNFIFYIGGVSALLGSVFGLAGWISTLFTLAFFYYAGEFEKHIARNSYKFKK